MSDYAKIYLTNGNSYNIDNSPTTIFNSITHSDGKPMDLMHQFSLLKGGRVYVNASHIVAVEEFNIEDQSAGEETEEKNRVEANEKAAKEFKEDIDGNME